MNEQSASSWQRRGSSLLFDQTTLGPLLLNDNLISLRQSLGWLEQWPAEPPTSPTILIGGLETCLDQLDVDEAEIFLQEKIRRLVEGAQSNWQRCGLVFGFSKPANTFQVNTTTDELTYIRTDQKTIHLARSLWGGATVGDVVRLVRNDGKEVVTLGYHVVRSS